MQHSLLILLISLVGIFRPAYPSLAQHVKIGLIFPLTGAAASWGKCLRQAAELSLEDAKKRGVKDLEIVFEDDQMKASHGVTAFRKLLDHDRVDATVIFGGQSVAANAGLADERGIPSFMITANQALTRGHPYSFRHWVDVPNQIAVLLPELQRLKAKRIASVATIHDAMLDYFRKFEAAAVASEMTVVFQEELNPGDTDLKSLVQKVKLAQPDVVVLSLLPPQISVFAKELRAQKITVPILGFSNMEDHSEVLAAAGSLEGAIYTGPPLSKDLISRYENQFGGYPELASGNVYDIITMVADAVESGARDREAITKFIKNRKSFSGALGTYGPNEYNELLVAAKLKQVSGETFVDYIPKE